MFRQLQAAVNIAPRRFTVEQLSAESGVSVTAIRSYMKGNPAERKEPSLSNALSLAVVLGPRAINAILSTIGYVAQAIEDDDAVAPAMIAAEAMEQVARFAKCAADNRIDHTEEQVSVEAVDNVIQLLAPFSSQGKAA